MNLTTDPSIYENMEEQALKVYLQALYNRTFNDLIYQDHTNEEAVALSLHAIHATLEALDIDLYVKVDGGILIYMDGDEERELRLEEFDLSRFPSGSMVH